jgi:acyl transferase domain-containing protein
MSQAGMLSPEGKCYSFDRRANGMVPGEAVVAVVLKRLERAQADGDAIYAVIRGSGINYDGKTNGMTAPSGAAQSRLIREVYERAGVNAEEMEYIVSHGTGTQLGDPVEINALCEAYRESTEAVGFCALTSSKTNFGHTFAASGLVSLVSLVEAMRHETIPASLHCEQESEYIVWEKSPFYVNKRKRKWEKKAGKSRLGGVSAFGMSGTNAHMVVESYEGGVEEEKSERGKKREPYYLLVLSAKTQAGVEEKAKELGARLREWEKKGEWSGERMRAVSYTLLCGRQHFEHRYAMVVTDEENGVHLCGQVGKREKQANVFRGRVGREFVEQKGLQRYGEELLGQLGGQGWEKNGNNNHGTNNKDERHAEEQYGEQYKEGLQALADLYCQGYDLSWERLFGPSRPQRIPLPTYPFARELYWVPPAKEPSSNSRVESETKRHASLIKPNGGGKEQSSVHPIGESVISTLDPSSSVATREILRKVFRGTVSPAEAKKLLYKVHGNGRTSVLEEIPGGASD